jgi:hypothetical protein
MNRTYCTLFDKNYLPHFLSLHDSLKSNVPYFVIYAFCMDDESYNFLLKSESKNIIPISYIELENHFTDLKIAKSNRTIIEYYFTCTSAICSFVFDNYSETGLLTYLDADLYFFSSPEPIYKELKGASVGIIEHKFNFFGKLLYEKYGKYNVGWTSFNNDKVGRKCLEEWRINCLNWCYDRLENGQFADQKYLDYWVEKYFGVQIIKNIGANLAPWNVGKYKIKIDSKTKAVKVDKQNLIFYHFASFKQLDVSEYKTNISLYFTYLSTKIKQIIYLPYLASLRKYNKEIGVEFNIKNRTDNRHKGFSKKMKELSYLLRRFIFNDNIKIK